MATEFMGATGSKGGRIAPVLDMLNFKDFGVSGPAGSATLTQSGLQQNIDPRLSALFGQFTGAAGNVMGQQLPPEVMQMLQGFGTTPLSNQMMGLSGQFASGLQGFDTNAFAAQQLDRLNQLAGPTEASAANSLANKLFSKGRMGGNDTAAGTAFGQLAQYQDMAKTQRALSAFGLAGQEADRLANYAQMFGGLGTTLQTSNLNNVGTSLMLPSQFYGNNMQAALLGMQGASATMDPMQQQIQNLFAGAGMMQDTRQAGAMLKYDRLFGGGDSANKGGGAMGAFGSAALTGIGTAIGGPVGGAIGGALGSAIFKPSAPSTGGTPLNLSAGGVSGLGSFGAFGGQYSN